MIPVLPADLTYVRANGGRAFASISNWDQDTGPVVGQRVIAADGGSERFPATIAAVRPDGVIVLSVEPMYPSSKIERTRP